jgi:hypothetical protein
MAATSVSARRGTDQFRGVFSDTWSVTATLDLASVADAETQVDTVAVPGVALGDVVLACSFGVDAAGLSITAYVSAADTVTVAANNNTGGAVNLASTTIKLVVARLV